MEASEFVFLTLLPILSLGHFRLFHKIVEGGMKEPDGGGGGQENRCSDPRPGPQWQSIWTLGGLDSVGYS